MKGIFGFGTITLGRVGDDPIPGVMDVRIDRKTIFGNPKHIGTDGTRTEVCEQYEIYARKQMEINGAYARRIRKLRKLYLAGQSIRLLCHCTPKKCHGSTVRRLIAGH